MINPDHAMLRRWTSPTDGQRCSPLAALLELQVDAVDRVHGSTTLRFAPPDALRRSDRVPNEIAIAAMLDFALSFAALASLEPPTTIVTATLRIERIGSSSAARFEAAGCLVARNAATLFVRATLRDDEARLVALASATLRLVEGRA